MEEDTVVVLIFIVIDRTDSKLFIFWPFAAEGLTCMFGAAVKHG